MKDNLDLNKLKAIHEITTDTNLNINIHDTVEKAMEVKIKRQTAKFFVLACILTSVIGLLAIKYSFVNIFVSLTIIFAILVPVSIVITNRKLREDSMR